MGDPEWKGGTFLRVILLLIVLTTWTFADDLSNSVCNMEPCWELYKDANDFYQADVPNIPNKPARECAELRTYKACLTKMNSAACAGTLVYESSIRILRSKFLTQNCTENGPVYPDGPEPQKTSPVIPCKFKGRPIYSYCALFGDPHLVTFDGKQVTCQLEGAWPLIDNEFLTVQVTNSRLSPSTKAATVTHKVTVVVKQRGSSDSVNGKFCGSREAIFYNAEIGSLPTSFTDGMKEYGAYNSIQVNTVTPGEQVEIYMRYIDSTVIIRQINNQYLSVGVRVPEKVLNGSKNNQDVPLLRQLCVDSCPRSERLNLNDLLSNISRGTSREKAAYAAAQQACRDMAITDFFFDSCVFDLLMTGEQLFSNMAHSAYEDVRKYASRQPRWSNRTQVEQRTKSLTTGNSGGAQASSLGVSSSVNNHGHLLIRTLLFVYIMHIVSFTVSEVM